MPLAEQADMIEQGDAEPITPGDLADHFRTQSYHLMEQYPIVATHLVLAAASLAPTCDDERNVAEEFYDLIGDFAVGLGRLHAYGKKRRLAAGQDAPSKPFI